MSMSNTNKEENKMTLAELADLKKLEAVISNVTKAANAGWEALKEIRDRKLYRKDFKTFELYCQSKWNLTGRRVRQLTDAATVVQLLTEKSGTMVPKNTSERAIRELSNVPEAKRAEVVKAVASAKKELTPGTIKEAADELKKNEPKPIQMDFTGYPIPPELEELWNRGSEPEEIISSLTKVRLAIKRAAEDKDKLFAEVDAAGTVAALNEVISRLRRAVPFAVCTQCQGRLEVQPRQKCTMCKGRGFISEFLYKTCVPEEIKKIRSKATKK